MRTLTAAAISVLFTAHAFAQDAGAVRKRIVGLLDKRIELAEELAQSAAKDAERTEQQFKAGMVSFDDMARLGTELRRTQMSVMDLRIERIRTLDRFANRSPRRAEVLALTRKKRAHATAIIEHQTKLLQHTEALQRAGRASAVDVAAFRRATMTARLTLLGIEQAIATLELEMLEATRAPR